MHKSMSLNYEPSSEPIHISTKADLKIDAAKDGLALRVCERPPHDLESRVLRFMC